MIKQNRWMNEDDRVTNERVSGHFRIVFLFKPILICQKYIFTFRVIKKSETNQFHWSASLISFLYRNWFYSNVLNLVQKIIHKSVKFGNVPFIRYREWNKVRVSKSQEAHRFFFYLKFTTRNCRYTRISQWIFHPLALGQQCDTRDNKHEIPKTRWTYKTSVDRIKPRRQLMRFVFISTRNLGHFNHQQSNRRQRKKETWW